MKGNANLEGQITELYHQFFKKLGIDKHTGKFENPSRWSFLRFPTFPYIGEEYFERRDRRVLFIGLEIGRDDSSTETITSFSEKRANVSNCNKTLNGLNPHFYGMGAATIFC